MNDFWCGFPDKHWKDRPSICPCGWVFPYRYHPDRPERKRERLPEPEPVRTRKRERLDLFDMDD